MAQGKTLLILGGGIGGIVAASKLRRALSREHRVVLVEQASTHLFQPSLLWLMLGLRAPGQISRPYTALARRRRCALRGCAATAAGLRWIAPRSPRLSPASTPSAM